MSGRRDSNPRPQPWQGVAIRRIISAFAERYDLELTLDPNITMFKQRTDGIDMTIDPSIDNFNAEKILKGSHTQKKFHFMDLF
jgi:hypothetical protein